MREAFGEADRYPLVLADGKPPQEPALPSMC
jgi:hypothetical protein